MILEGAYILRENYSSVATVSGVVVFVKGYRDDSLFRHYAAPPSVQLLPLTIQLWPPEVSDEQLKQQALETCIRDFVISPEWPGLSRGFLDGLPTLLNEAGPSSDLTGAARILTLAAVGNRMGRTSLVYSTAQQYGNLLLSFQASLTRPGIHKVHLLVTGVLLGLYEIVSSSTSYPGHHVTHVRGVCAMFSSELSPFDFSTGVTLFQLSDTLLLKQPLETPGVLCVPIHQDVVQNLDLILIRCNTLFKNAKSILQKPTPLHKEILALYHDAECLDRDFICWTKNQPKEWMPTPVGTIQKSAAESSTCGYCWEGQVDNYLDLFVVAVWNTYRKTHVMLLEILDNCIQCLSTIENDIILSLHQRANTLIKSFVASIPYHLAPDPATFIQAIDRKEEIPPARPVGGLLLLYPLFVVAHCPLVSAPLRAYFRNCLGWIGKYMGIGQANLLSEPIPVLPYQDLIEGHILIWAGMLLRSSSTAQGIE